MLECEGIYLKYFHQKFDTDPMVPFPPVAELDLPGAFITKHPRETIAEEHKNSVISNRDKSWWRIFEISP